MTDTQQMHVYLVGTMHPIVLTVRCGLDFETLIGQWSKGSRCVCTIGTTAGSFCVALEQISAIELFNPDENDDD